MQKTMKRQLQNYFQRNQFFIVSYQRGLDPTTGQLRLMSESEVKLKQLYVLTKYGKPFLKPNLDGSNTDNKQLYCHVCDHLIEGFEAPYAHDHMVNHLVLRDGYSRNGVITYQTLASMKNLPVNVLETKG
jgi:hypothetical protein